MTLKHWLPTSHPDPASLTNMTLLTADFHCHTYRSKDSLLLPGRLLEIARQRGIDRL